MLSQLLPGSQCPFIYGLDRHLTENIHKIHPLLKIPGLVASSIGSAARGSLGCEAQILLNPWPAGTEFIQLQTIC